MKKIVLILACITLCGCSSNKEIFEYKKVDSSEMKELMNNNDYIIIDVRSKEEFSGNHIKEAINIPHDKIEESILPTADIIFVYCMSGTRSKYATNTLIDLGYKAYDLGALENIDLERG